MGSWDGSIVLASASESRRQIIRRLGLPTKAIASCVDEYILTEWTPETAVTQLALRKARAVWHQHGTARPIIIGADTVIVFEHEILGKPRSIEEAEAVLYRLKGMSHTILTCTAAIATWTGETVTKLDATQVTMRCYSDQEIVEYLATGESMNKAGSYAIQGHGQNLVEKFHGDFESATGLSSRTVRTLIEKLSDRPTGHVNTGDARAEKFIN
ncbi:Maf family protein [Nocardia sp. CA-135398]|uniref:Maf family protein n=1 Tax=Nocardia sp. CA-135398 TaxID=3239977 RepID=UPI003D9595C3